MNQQYKYLIHTSGGFDSTWSLIWFLNNHTDKIIAHFLDYKTKNHMDSMQRLAFLRVQKYIEQNYPKRVKWMESVLDMKNVDKPLDILIIAAFTGAIHKQFPELEYIIKSAPLDEQFRLGRSLADRRERSELIAAAVSGRGRLKVIEPIRAHRKKYAWDKSGKWKHLTWSCRRPINGKACGRCHSCIMLSDPTHYE